MTARVVGSCRWRWALALVLGLALGSWSGPGAAADGGRIVGRVRVAGAPPVPRTVDVNKDNRVCGREKKIVDVAVDADGGLAGAVVSIPDMARSSAAARASLDQKGCQFRPQVLVMAPGKLDIRNSDGVLHNIHSISSVNPPFNHAQPRFRKILHQEIDRPEVIEIRCDVHSWMHGWLFVTDHPAVVTDAGGNFTISKLSPGTHRVEVWHPVLGRQSRTVEVKPGQATTVTFELKAAAE